MAEQPEDLHETLARLHAELEATSDLGEDSRRRLRAALEEIQTKLGEGTGEGRPTGEEDEDWSDRLRHYAEKLESSHPDLVRAIDRVARALSGVGF